MTNTNLELVFLGQDGISYVETSLRQGTGLCAEVLKQPLANGEAFAPLPKCTTVDRAKVFNTGGLLSRHDGYIWLAQHIQSLWQIDEIGTFVIQDIWAKPTDAAAQKSGLNKFFHDENVYYFLNGLNADFWSVQRAARAVTSYLFVALFSHINIQYDNLPPDHLVGEHFIIEIARSAVEVFVGAYDQEGLVIWRG
jgi:hypothetical protein